MTHPIVKELKKIRREQRCSQDALGALSGINSRSHINKLESGRTSPTLMTLAKWADVLGYEIALKAKQ
jgi:transcriptional regulator with XRE-family HTH domain